MKKKAQPQNLKSPTSTLVSHPCKFVMDKSSVVKFQHQHQLNVYNIFGNG